MAEINAVPKGLTSVIAQLTVPNASEAIEFYKKIFNAEVVDKAMDESGKKVMHATLRINDTSFFCNDAFPEWGGDPASAATLWLYADDADFIFTRAVEAGCTVLMPMTDQFWGDRSGTVKDRFGIKWNIAKHVKDMTAEEQRKAGEAFMKGAKK